MFHFEHVKSEKFIAQFLSFFFVFKTTWKCHKHRIKNDFLSDSLDLNLIKKFSLSSFFKIKATLKSLVTF